MESGGREVVLKQYRFKCALWEKGRLLSASDSSAEQRNRVLKYLEGRRL